MYVGTCVQLELEIPSWQFPVPSWKLSFPISHLPVAQIAAATAANISSNINVWQASWLGSGNNKNLHFTKADDRRRRPQWRVGKFPSL